MSEKAARIPSVDALSRVRSAILDFLNRDRYSFGATSDQEDNFLPFFTGLANALRPIRPLIGSIKGWPPRIDRALRAIVENFDAITMAWGWEKLDVSEQSAYLNERRAWFQENVERPMYDAALSWQAGCRTLLCPIDGIADKGREFYPDLKPSMTPEEGESRFSELQLRWLAEPRFGNCFPRIAESQRIHLMVAGSMIECVLKAIDLPASRPLATTEAIGDSQPSEARDQSAAPQTGETKPTGPPAELPDLVTLDQAAALVNRTPPGLRHYRAKGMPKPFIRGKRGQPNEFLWSEMRPWLEKTFNRPIPDIEIKKFRAPAG